MSEFTVKIDARREVCWQSSGHAWSLRAHGVQGPATVEVLIDDEPLVTLDADDAGQLERGLALLHAPEASAGAREKKRKTRPAKAGKPWSPEDDEELTQRWNAGELSADLAPLFARSRNAILARLVTLGLEPDLAAATRADRDPARPRGRA